ncbi:type I methionyl aminopeptidase [Mobilicoccus sp.]|uniref:type I methionyl aminopeptidase n=1 Tax=Mobilicoccus sp. TaxID=2034349 RepID=UPI00289EF9C3|nr:type I methionyl aminopeptidase [Mobilicoccus sp.]
MWSPPWSERLPARSPDEVEAMRVAGTVVAETLAAVKAALRPGATTGEIDALAEAYIRSRGARPSFPDVPGYRHTLCVSVNDEVVHGIPGPRRLEAGDVVSVDCGASVEGWHGDSAITAVVGGAQAARPQDLELIDACTDALWAGIGAFVVGGRLFDVGEAVEASVNHSAARLGRETFGILDGYEGHGIGREMHERPGVPNVAVRARGPRIRPGATVAIEPMITLGTEVGHTLTDGWTVVTTDGSRGAHVEHTVAATPEGPWVLTASDGGRAELTRRGLPCGAPG